MSWQAITMYCVVAGVGIPAAFRNPTALAMVIAWLFVELVYQITGNSLPLKFSFMADIAVIAVIYAKSVKRCGPKVYPSVKDQLRCLVTDLPICDRLIVAIFLFAMWPLYIISDATLHPYYRWLALWALAILQFLLAGGEAVALVIRSRRDGPTPPPIIDHHLVVIPFPVQCRDADAVRKTPELSGALLIANRGGGYG